MATLRLVRHGEAAAAWGGDDDDPGLSARGHRQAAAVAQLLAATPPSRILTSPLRRCRETAAPLAAALGLAPVVALDVAETPTPRDLPAAGRGAWLSAALEGEWRDVPGGDYLAWRDGVARFVATCGDAVVFTHFVAINAAVSAALGDPRVLVLRPDHASVTTLEVVDGRLRLVERGGEAGTRVL